MDKKMKRILLMILMAVAAVGAWAKGEVQFASREHDFGTIKATGGAVTATYEFTNTGDEPVSIVTVTNRLLPAKRELSRSISIRPPSRGSFVAA